jgi:WD40 repeat protein
MRFSSGARTSSQSSLYVESGYNPLARRSATPLDPSLAGQWPCPGCKSAEVAYEPTASLRRCGSCGLESTCRVFLSYARGDDEPFVARLHADLTGAGFDVWWDRVSLPSRQLTFHQEIKDAIRQRDRLVYVAGPKAALSDYVCEEWQFAIACDKPVIPILRVGNYDAVPASLGLLHCEDFRDDASYAAQLAKLVDHLRRPEPPLGGLFAVPNLPPHFLGRADLVRRLKDAVQVDLQKPVVITGAGAHVGLQGMGGIGKSVLAAAVARDREVRRSYPDGILWVAVGQQPDLPQLLRDMAHHLSHAGQFENVPQGQAALRELLLDKAILLVLDDVWKAADAQAFDVLGPRCRALVTTRDAAVLQSLHGERLPVDLFTETEALALLAAAVGRPPAELPAEAKAVVGECGGLPLAVALCGGMARKRGGGWRSILERLRRADLEKIADRESINAQHGSIWRAMQVSVEALEPAEQRRFAELSVFATDRPVTAAAVATLWAHTGSFNDLDTEDLLISLSERALIRLDKDAAAPDGPASRRVSLHDLLYDYAVRTAGDRRALHETLLEAYRPLCPGGWHTGPADGYFLRHVCQHLAEARGNWDEAAELLGNLDFTEARCRVGEVFELQHDFRAVVERLPEAQADVMAERKRQARIERWTAALTSSAAQWSDRRDRMARGEEFQEPEPVLPEPPSSCRMWTEEQIAAEGRRMLEQPTRVDRLRLNARFVAQETVALLEFGGLPTFVAQHAQNTDPRGPVHGWGEARLSTTSSPHLVRRWPPAAPYAPNPALLRTLEGHAEEICGVAVTSDGRRALSAGDDGTIRVWDTETGSCLRTLEGHTDRVTTVASMPNGRRAVSASWDHTLRVWDVEVGACLRTLEGHADRVEGVAVTPDGRCAVSGSWDQTLRVWELETGACLRTLGGHTERITTVAMAADGRRAVSGGADGSLRVWNLETGVCLQALEGHTTRVFSVAVTPEGHRAASGSFDGTLRVWNVEAGVCLRTWSAHAERISAVAITADGLRVVSGGRDQTLRVWDVGTGARQRTFDAHAAGVSAVAVTPDGRRAVSGGLDRAVRMWDLETGASLRAVAEHTGPVPHVAVTPDGRQAVSASWDHTLGTWNAETGAWIRTLDGHAERVDSVTVTAYGRHALSGSEDKTLRVWDMETATCLRTLTGHAAEVRSVVAAQDGGRAVSASADQTLRVWDLETGTCLQTLTGHAREVDCVALAPDGRLAVSGSVDRTLRVWDLNAGLCLRTLAGHAGRICSLTVTPDGRRAVSSCTDQTLRVWDLEAGSCLLTLAGHADRITSIAVTADGRRVMSASSDRTLRMWDLETGTCLLTLTGHASGIDAVAVVAGGRCAATGGEDNTLRVWDLETGTCLAVGRTRAPVSVVAPCCADGLVAGLENGSVLFYTLRRVDGPDSALGAPGGQTQ